MAARPAWVRTIGAYATWVEQAVEGRGGHFDGGELAAERLQVVGREVYRLGNQWLDFYDRGQVFLKLVVAADLALLRYGYHRQVGGTMVCRLDKHQGHESDDGVPTHLHHGDGRRTPTVELDVDDALDLVLGYGE